MAVVCDLLARFLRKIYPKVTYVSNITDIDDKIINASLETNIPINFKKGKSYYFITGVNSANVAGAILGGAIGTAIVGGPFPSHQVTKEIFDRNKGK